jgi:hypothetical protein
MKEVTILGKTYPIEFTLQTILNYEELNNGNSFFEANFDAMKERIAIVVSAILAADKDADIDFDRLAKIDNWKQAQEIVQAYVTVMELSTKFFNIPEIEKKNDPAPAEAESDEKPKN